MDEMVVKTMRQNETNKTIGYWILYIFFPVLILCVWEGADLLHLLHSYSMPSLKSIISTIIEYWQNGKLVANILISFWRVLEGVLIALVFGLGSGILVSVFPRFNTFTDLVIQILRPIPPIAWIPLAILWFGIGESSKIFIIFLGAFFPIFLNTVDGIRSVDSKYFELVEVYEVSKKDLIFKLIIPGALPSIMTGIRLGIGSAWVCVVAAEMIGATSGVGYMLSDGRSLSRPDIVILGMLMIGVFGKIMDDLLKRLRDKVITWI